MSSYWILYKLKFSQSLEKFQVGFFFTVYLTFQLMESGYKVEGWLSKQQESGTFGLGGKDQYLQIVKTWILDHVKVNDDEYLSTSNRFTVSESGAIGISCKESPSLSVIYPDTDKPPVVLSDATVYHSATFLKVQGKEYLAASSDEDGCLYLWDVESKTSRKVFDPKLPKEKQYKDMTLCKINGNTVAYSEELPLLDGSRRIFILKTDTEELTLSSTLSFFTEGDLIDMCHTSMTDGTEYLHLCFPWVPRVQTIQMIDGRPRWEVGKEQMGEKFHPWSICSNDDNDIIYVADYNQEKIHLLSAADGMVIKRFEFGSYFGFNTIFTVRIHNEYLYVEYMDEKRKYVIVKFKRIE